MIEQGRVSSMPQLRTYQIPTPTEDASEDTYVTRKVTQDLIDQADEDLLCAIGCWRHNPHEPFSEICYLLHQSLEKWIKVAIQMSIARRPGVSHKNKHTKKPSEAKRFPPIHDIEILLSPFCKTPLIREMKFAKKECFPQRKTFSTAQINVRRWNAAGCVRTLSKIQRKKPDMSTVADILQADPIFMSSDYPNRVRYRENTGIKFNLNAQAFILKDAVFMARRLVKHWLKIRENRRLNAPTYFRM